MFTQKYLPEGSYIGTQENNEYFSSISGLERAMNENKILEAMVLRCNSDFTLTVDLGKYVGYIEREEAALTYGDEPIKDIAVITRVGKPVCFKILSIELDSHGEYYVRLSRKAAQIECTENMLAHLKPGDIIRSSVTHLEQFGAFVDVGCGVASLLSIDCISVSRISHPKDRFSVGDSILCVVKKNDEDGKRIFVTHKELLGTWEENAADFTQGQTVTGIVRSIEEYGIFIELSPNLAGLAEYKEGIKEGQIVSVFIKSIIPERMKIKLVIIDSYPAYQSTNTQKYKYYLDDGNIHIDTWKYSPDMSNKWVETVFD